MLYQIFLLSINLMTQIDLKQLFFDSLTILSQSAGKSLISPYLFVASAVSFTGRSWFNDCNIFFIYTMYLAAGMSFNHQASLPNT